ncbi:MAG: FtsX-like permease family protein [Thermoplasmata archaeon]|nr:FtsX-like permease family protein [Thermoplasmata archaeon]
MIDPVVVFLLFVLLVVGVISLALALRNRLPFRIAMRNVRRGRARTVLLLLGLLVGTTIISGSLTVGDTVTQLSVHYTYLGDGLVDESIAGPSATGGHLYFAYATYTQLAASTSSDTSIAGVTPMVQDLTQAYDRTTGIPQTSLNLVGANGNQSAALGSFVSTSGTTLAGPTPGNVLLDQLAAASMNASAGDTLLLFGPQTLTVTVQAIVQENLRGAYLTAGVSGGDVFTDLATAQALENQSGRINFIAVTNAGSQHAGVALSDGVSRTLNASLAAIPGASNLKVTETLKNDVANAQTSASSTSTIFLVLGLFSIVAGAMLIIGIFVMLAEERKGEMGMLRAIGLRRGQLVLTYYFEGLAYSLGSAAAGTALGVAAGYLLVYAFAQFIATGGLTATAILDSFTVTNTSLVESYVLGFLLTLITVVVASRRASRLNIVRAIRDIPEPRPALRLYTYLAYLGIVAVALGGLLFATTYRGSSDLSEPILGGSMVIIGLGLIASRLLPNRVAFTAVGVGVLAWAGAEPLHAYLLGNEHGGGIFIVFVEGILMVFGALLIYIFNSNVLVGALTRLASGRKGASPVVRIGLSYPSRQSTRTAINLTIFALVVFTMVAIATFGATINANLNNVTETQSGGYNFFGFSSLPIPDLPGQIANNSTLAPAFSAVVPLVSGAVTVNLSGWTGNPYIDSVYSAPANASPSSSFYTTNQFPFSQTLHGMTASEVMHALATDPTVAIVDQNYAPTANNLGGGPTAPHPTVTIGESIGIGQPGVAGSKPVTVIGVMKQSIFTGIWVNPAFAASLGYTNDTAYFLTVHPGVSTSTTAQHLKKAFFRYGLVLFDIGALLAVSIDTEEGFIGLLEIFVGLGLAVGIAAMGILALRAVVERRREIGMLRAAGFTQAMVLKAFVLEYSFVTLLGLAIGTTLGLLIVYDLSISPSAAASGVSTFFVPWTNVLLVIVIAYALAIAAIAGPSIRASRTPPADAVRATE